MLSNLFGRKRSASQSKADRKASESRIKERFWQCQMSPGTVLDLSECGILQLPDATYSTCITLRKDTLLAGNNLLTFLDPQIGRLVDLTILDLHKNALEVVPPEIGKLKSLKSLDLSFNKLKKLPVEIGHLTSLYSLRLRGNELTSIPGAIGALQLLTLDLCDNHLYEIPAEFSQFTIIQELLLSGNAQLKFPSQSVIAGGTKAIMEAICTAQGKTFVPSSASSLAASAVAHINSSGVALLSVVDALKLKQREDEALVERHMKTRQLESEKLQEATLQRERLYDAQVREQRQLEEHLKDLRAQAHASELALRDGELQRTTSKLMEQQAEDQKKLILEILNSHKKDQASISDYIVRMEEDRIGIEIQKQLARDKQLLDHQLSKARDEAERQHVKQMQEALKLREESEAKMQFARLKYEKERDDTSKRVEELHAEFQKRLQATYVDKDTEMAALISRIAADDSKFKKEFEFWRFEKDALYNDLSSQIHTIQADITRLNAVVRKHKDDENELEAELLSTEEKKLFHRMCILIEAQQAREIELRTMIKYMSDEHTEQQKRLWLHDFAALMARKPSDVPVPPSPSTATAETAKLVNRYVETCGPEVKKRLEALGLEHLIPIFARERVDISSWHHLNDIHLQAIGVSTASDRNKILDDAKM